MDIVVLDCHGSIPSDVLERFEHLVAECGPVFRMRVSTAFYRGHRDVLRGAGFREIWPTNETGRTPYRTSDYKKRGVRLPRGSAKAKRAYQEKMEVSDEIGK